MTQLLLIRHGHNDWVDHRLAGWTPGVHLNDQGHAEARALAERLADYPLEAVYASPLERALETAAYLAEPRGLAVRVLPALGEVRFGEWTGQALEVLRAEPLWLQMRAFPSRGHFPGGESLVEVQARVLAAMDTLCLDHPRGAVAVVSHADVIKAAVAHLVGAHLDMFRRLAVATASLTVVRVDDQGPHLLLFNDTGAVPPPEPPAMAAEPPA